MSDFRNLRHRVATNITGDRGLALIGIFATLILGVLGILASAAQEQFPIALIVTVVLVVLISAPLVVLLREPRRRTITLAALPFRIKSMKFTTDISAKDGSLAVLRHEEETVCQRDSLISLRRGYWGEWDELQLDDLRCLEPGGAKVVDIYKEVPQTMFLTSLRHLYNTGDAFRVTHELTVRNGFTNPKKESVEWTIALPVDALEMSVILPEGKVLIPGSPLLRAGTVTIYNEMALPDDAVKFTEDGRYQIVWQMSKPRQQFSYGIHWKWKDKI